ncbi:MAG: 3-oxoacyl-[acyl-carrier-protein] synthase [Solirubrobacteraceae bacterium]|nr:3-oxoacyl-[acyl-carrier-protein] synthase [Solirubrobacteraceae bacterium]
MIAACRDGVALLGIGSHVPERVMTNDEIAAMVDTSDEWIAQRTGIRERRIAAPHESSASLGAEAARRAIESAGIDPGQLDLIVAATASPDYYFPATASLIGERIGADNVAGYDLSAACTGFIYALAQGYSQIASGLAETVLVVGTEVFSRLLDWSDRSTCILFGDGAGAVVLQRDDGVRGLRGFELGADGKGALLLSVAAAGHSETEPEGPYVQMNGPEVYKFATRVVVESSERCLQAAGLTVADVDVFVPHQANRRIIDHAARRLGLDEQRVFSNVDRYGNTSAGSIPICLDEAWREGRIGPGDIVLMVGFGGGLAWGSCVMEWTKERP